MFKRFQHHLESHLPFLGNSRLLIAISGGIDSVVLTHLCYQAKLNIILAHCNFNLRGVESDADEAFVVQLAEDLNLEFFVERFDTEGYAATNKRSTQMAARELRYNWFYKLSKQLGCDYVLTAHHADDNLETFLINFTRGTGLEGLTGIPEVNDIFVRPLLPFSRAEIHRYAKGLNIKWVEDKSNASTKYLRNKLRHDIVPVLKEINPSLLQSFQSTLNNLNDTASIVEDRMEDFLNHTIEQVSDKEMKFKVSEFKKVNHPKAYLYEAFKTYGFTQWDDILDLLDAQAGKQVFSSSHRLIKDRAYLLLTEITCNEIGVLNVSETDKYLETNFGTLLFEVVDTVSKVDTKTVFIDKDTLTYPLTIRKKEGGDVFYPVGMHGRKKKLSKYFKDEKFSLLDKENTRLLCSNNDIVWVIGKRGDNRFKVTENTKHILKITLK